MELTGGRVIGVPVVWYPRLASDTDKQRSNCRITARGLHWPDIDEDLSIAGLIEGRKGVAGRSPS